MERISVIVPAYNNAPDLRRCLDSLMAQTHPDLEVIVVNDGSTDNTAQVLDDYAAGHPVKVIHQENGGVTAARLRGVEEAAGDWVGFVDGDDAVEPQMYARLLENAHEYHASISHCGQQVIFPDGRVSVLSHTGEIREQDRLTGLRDLLDGAAVQPGLCTKLYKKSLFEGLSDWMDRTVRNNEDLLMNYYLFSRADRSVFEAVSPYRYLLREGSASYRRPPKEKIFDDQLRVRQIILSDCGEELKADARRALLRNALFLYSWAAKFPRRDYPESEKKVRELLKENRNYFGVLSPRNQVLANLICTAPWAFRWAYRFYIFLFQRQEQH